MTARLMKALLFACGTLCVGLGILGIFLPLMPTTVFLLMAAACYARSSDRFYRKLVEHPWLGPYIRQRHGLSTRQKAIILTALWISLGATMLWTARAPWLRILLLAVGAGVTLHVARLPRLADVTPLEPGAAPSE
ncbi:MAG TPA: YbaN family protein [Vicinamibacterales bacterium]|nr:YbaN family protein [Vicinamibacterales bacterium]